MYIVCLNSGNSIFSRHFVQHADAKVYVPQVALTSWEMRLISVIALSTFMSILFLELVGKIFRKVKIVRSKYGIIHRQFYIHGLVYETGK